MALSPVRPVTEIPVTKLVPTEVPSIQTPANQISDSEPALDVDDDWRAVASCRDTDPDLFFPVGTTGPAIDQIEAAKAVCRECDAQAPCLEFALTSNQDSGIWGGTSEEERRKLRRQWLAAKRRAS